MTPPAHPARDAEARLQEAGVAFVRLLGGSGESGVRHLLVRRGDARTAERALERTAWRYHAGRSRLACAALFTWDGGASVWLHSGVPAAPLPRRALGGLERRVWAGARPGADGVPEPDPVDALLVAAVQLARPGFPRPAWRAQVLRLAADVDREHATAVARELGLAASLARALGGARPRETPRERVWAAGRLLQRSASSRRVAALLDGEQTPGHAVFRTRFAGIEVDSGRGVFLPVAFSEELVAAALERTAGARGPVVIDVGTGCGAVALAVGTASPAAEVHGVDVSGRALRWARRNARRLGVRNARFHRGSLVDPLAAELRGRVDVLLTNVPYVPPAQRRAGWDDMPGTIRGEDEDGLGLPRRLAADARDLLSSGGWLVAQLAADQSAAFSATLDGSGYAGAAVIAERAGDVVVAARRRA